MQEYIKCATGPDLWIFWEKTFIFEYQKCHRCGTCGITWKNARIYKMYHRSGPVNILRKNFYFQISKVRQVWTCGITWKNARIYKICHRSGPVNILRKTFISKYQKFNRSGPVELRQKMLEYIKCATGPDLWIFFEKNFYF